MASTLYYFPACPFCQRLEILLALRGEPEEVRRCAIDLAAPRPPWLLEKTHGSTALPALELEDGRVLKESLVLLRYLDEQLPGPPLASTTPYGRAVEGMLVRAEGDFVAAGYGLLKNRDPALREPLRAAMLAQYRRLDALLVEHAPAGPFLHGAFGWAEAVFTPFFVRFACHAYYEGLELPYEPGYARVRAWRDACLAHPAAQQVSVEQAVKLYYDYAIGVGGGAVPPGRARSSFVATPDWRQRPWPPRDKYGLPATDEELGLG